MMTSDKALASVDYYDDLAMALSPTYDSLSFEQANSGVASYLPARPANVLDVGAGSGRDARALAAMGHHVLAVEPSEAFRRIAATNGGGIAWVDDRLPDLTSVTSRRLRFDFILCSAVLMLMPPEDLAPSFETLAGLLLPSGRLAITIRSPALDEPPEIFHAHSDEDVVGSAAAAGLEVLQRTAPSDALGRHALRWRSFVFGPFVQV